MNTSFPRRQIKTRNLPNLFQIYVEKISAAYFRFINIQFQQIKQLLFWKITKRTVCSTSNVH